jgi:hypothetical protein
MAGGGNLSSQLTAAYNQLFSTLPPSIQTFMNVILLVLLVVIFCIFIWKIYTIISKKNLLELNLKQYGKGAHPFWGTLLYFVEYILIFPFFVILWFLAFTFFLIFLTKGLDVPTVLMVSTIIIIAIRATAYYREGLSRELAKLLPFTLLAVAMTEKGFFNFEEIFGRFSQVPSLFHNILGYIAIIVLIEVVLRIFDFIFSLFELEDVMELEEEEEARGSNQED